MES
ncbi:FAD binding domain protein, partial [Vibrio parahaemolyticus EKP-021]|jgi:hypothetical protein